MTHADVSSAKRSLNNRDRGARRAKAACPKSANVNSGPVEVAECETRRANALPLAKESFTCSLFWY